MNCYLFCLDLYLLVLILRSLDGIGEFVLVKGWG